MWPAKEERKSRQPAPFVTVDQLSNCPVTCFPASSIWPGSVLPTCLLTCGVWQNGCGAEKMKVLLCAGSAVFFYLFLP